MVSFERKTGRTFENRVVFTKIVKCIYLVFHEYIWICIYIYIAQSCWM